MLAIMKEQLQSNKKNKNKTVSVKKGTKLYCGWDHQNLPFEIVFHLLFSKELFSRFALL
jgi:hypothetical protein